jgi:hypothetical protein
MGWFLIIPAPRNGLVPPVSQWRHAGVFENADYCATARKLVVDTCRQDLDDLERKIIAERQRGIVSSEDEESATSFLGRVMTIALSRCIASDDPGAQAINGPADRLRRRVLRLRLARQRRPV